MVAQITEGEQALFGDDAVADFNGSQSGSAPIDAQFTPSSDSKEPQPGTPEHKALWQAAHAEVTAVLKALPADRRKQWQTQLTADHGDKLGNASLQALRDLPALIRDTEAQWAASRTAADNAQTTTPPASDSNDPEMKLDPGTPNPDPDDEKDDPFA
jgi:hypothetical protein